MHQNQKVYQESVSKLKYIMHKNSGAKTAVFLIHGYGASTKGNVLLQYCNINSNDINYICLLYTSPSPRDS